MIMMICEQSRPEQNTNLRYLIWWNPDHCGESWEQWHDKMNAEQKQKDEQKGKNSIDI